MASVSTTRGLSFDPATAAAQRERKAKKDERAQANRALARELDQKAKEERLKRWQIEDAYKERVRDGRKSLPRRRGRVS